VQQKTAVVVLAHAMNVDAIHYIVALGTYNFKAALLQSYGEIVVTF
jgi:hypothetical protein